MHNHVDLFLPRFSLHGLPLVSTRIFLVLQVVEHALAAVHSYGVVRRRWPFELLWQLLVKQKCLRICFSASDC